MTVSTPSAAPEERSEKRRKIVAFALAALAVGGLGAAVTSAAWTDNVFFAADASAATFNLQGSLDDGTWAESDDEDAIELVVPASAFQNLLPGQQRTVNLWVRNEGNVPAALTSSTAWTSDAFTSDTQVAVSGLEPTLAAGASDQFTLTLTAPADWAESNKGKQDTLVVTIAGTAVAP